MFRVVFAAAVAVALAATAEAKPMPPPDMLSLAEQASAAVVAKVESSKTESARLAIERVLGGKVGASALDVAAAPQYGCIGPPTAAMPAGERFVVFLVREPDGGHRALGQWNLRAEAAEATVRTAERMLALAALPDAAKRTDGLFGFLAEDDATLRAQAIHSLRIRLSGKAEVQAREDGVLAALASERPDVRLFAAERLRDFPSPKALDTLIAYSRSDDLRLADATSLALARYDTTESVAAIAALVARPGLEKRAIIDLSASRRPEAMEALLAATRSASAEIRGFAAERLHERSIPGRAEVVVPRLLEMLDDPATEARIGAARGLFECRSGLAIRRLLAMLGDGSGVSGPEAEAYIRTLYGLSQRIGIAETKLISDATPAFSAALRRHPQAWRHAVSLLERIGDDVARDALRWAAGEHTVSDARDAAERALEALARRPSR